MKKIGDVLQSKKKTFSFEFNAPKTEKGIENLYKNADIIYNELEPDFFSVTYGAGGSTHEKTTEIVVEMARRYDIPIIHHLTMVGQSKDEIKSLVDDFKGKGLTNILALRGDPPRGQADWVAHEGGYKYASELCAFLKSYGDTFSVGVAGFPEGHPESPNKDLDIKYLIEKVNAGGEYVLTQLFFDNQDYFNYRDSIVAAGSNVRVIPGLLPVLDYQGMLRFTKTCHAKVTAEVHDLFKPVENDTQKMWQTGVDFATFQGQELLDNGAPGLHLYTLNKSEAVLAIMKNIRR